MFNLICEFLGRFFPDVSGEFVNIRVNFFFYDLMTVRVVCRKFIGVGVVLHPANVMTQVVPFGLLVASLYKTNPGTPCGAPIF